MHRSLPTPHLHELVTLAESEFLKRVDSAEQSGDNRPSAISPLHSLHDSAIVQKLQKKKTAGKEVEVFSFHDLINTKLDFNCKVVGIFKKWKLRTKVFHLFLMQFYGLNNFFVCIDAADLFS